LKTVKKQIIAVAEKKTELVENQQHWVLHLWPLKLIAEFHYVFRGYASSDFSTKHPSLVASKPWFLTEQWMHRWGCEAWPHFPFTSSSTALHTVLYCPFSLSFSISQ
jgi:hypothetical protein